MQLVLQTAWQMIGVYFIASSLEDKETFSKINVNVEWIRRHSMIIIRT